MLVMFVNDYKDDWDEYLLLLIMVYWVLVYESIKCILNILMLGREILFFIDIIIGLLIYFNDVFIECFVKYVEWLKEVM